MALTLTGLPYTIFTDIISRLSATEAILCQRISRAFREALTRNDLCISLILTHFPRSLEGRRLRALLRTGDLGALERGDWAAVFARLARRYFHLGNAVPWKVVKVPVLKDDKRLRGVTPWNRFLSLNGKTAPFHFWDPVWTVASAEGLLVYPAPMGEDVGFRARDLETGVEVDVPFDMSGKIVRRVRISHGILMMEWCEQQPSRAGNGDAAIHRHYATAYTVRRIGPWDGVIPRRDGQVSAYSWAFEFLCECKIHHLGLPINHQDRFFSTHNATHYVVYTWQPARSPWEDEPLERLTIWEFGSPSTYRPSQDPFGTANRDDSGPRIIRSMTNGQLREWAIRQSDTPALRVMALDDCTWDAARGSACGHVFFTEEEHRWSAGPHSSSNPPRLHRVKTTGIPLIGEGPRWVDDCGGGGGVNLPFCCDGRWARRLAGADDNIYDASDESLGDGNEKAWNSNHSHTWPGRAPCWRHDDWPYVTLSEVFDAAAGVRVIARECFMLETLSVHIRPKIRIQGIGESGAKFTARGTTMSRTSRRRKRRTRRPSIARSGGSSSGSSSSTTSHQGQNQAPEGNETAASSSSSNSGKGGVTTQGPDGQEVQFADDVWPEMMAKGFICGDERWLVGEDAKGDVTIIVF
ncbi:F-box domain-containing protein [Trichoderma simmonsii]|uniref:F-box domain-containing protein n=1 Tax=Trichoderma simmonsii TaxID=1491479 RepID=A0A8G0LFE5_9HYPO|nr:F-box domain-containing protein [Trichoderma simmonsii]